jgi:transcriptional regulator with XRE-family HTH domain
MISSLLEQLKNRRLALGLKQSDMMLRVGISRQQYQRLESKGNPRLDTLELLAKGLNSQLMLIPKEKLAAVRAVLGCGEEEEIAVQSRGEGERRVSDDPWRGLLGDDS